MSITSITVFLHLGAGSHLHSVAQSPHPALSLRPLESARLRWRRPRSPRSGSLTSRGMLKLHRLALEPRNGHNDLETHHLYNMFPHTPLFCTREQVVVNDEGHGLEGVSIEST